MTIQAHKLSIRKVLASLSVLSVFIATTLFMPLTATNAIPPIGQDLEVITTLTQAPTNRTYLASRWVETLFQCLSKGATATPTRYEISRSDAANLNIFENRSGEDNDEIDTGYDLDPSDARMSCQEIEANAKSALVKLGVDPTKFVEVFYTLDGDKYKFNGDDARNLARSTAEEIGNLNDANSGSELSDIRYAIAFAQCFEEAPDITPAQSDTPNLSNAFYYRSGKDANSKIELGDNFRPITPDDNSESCGSILGQAEGRDIEDLLDKYDFTTDMLKSNPYNFYATIAAGAAIDEREEEAQEEVMAKINSNIGAVMQCLSATQISVPSNDTLATWLLSGDNSLLDDIQNPGNTPPKLRTDALLLCLTEAITGLEEDIQEFNDDVDSIEDNLEDTLTQNGGGDAEECLTNSNQFIAWLACPILDIIDGFLNTIEETIKKTLQFNLGDQNKGDGLKDAWNVFRGLATTLIIAGFMLALVIKGVKG